MVTTRQHGRRVALRERLRHSLHLPSMVDGDAANFSSLPSDRARWVQEACCLLVSGASRVRQMLTRLCRPTSHSHRMQVLPHRLGHRHMRCHRFTVGVEGPLCLPIRRHHQPSISFTGLFTNESAVFAKSSPLFSLTSPRYSPQSPSFSPTSLRYSPTSLSFIPASPRCKFISRHCLSSLTEKFHF